MYSELFHQNYEIYFISNNFIFEQNVGLTGPIPSEYGEFAHMDYLAIISTSLNGKIPSTFGDLKKLQVLSLEVRAYVIF